jgi:hypothetical protein
MKGFLQPPAALRPGAVEEQCNCGAVSHPWMTDQDGIFTTHAA